MASSPIAQGAAGALPATLARGSACDSLTAVPLGPPPASADARFRSATLQRKLGAPTTVLANARGQLLAWAVPARGLFVSVGSGHGCAEFTRPFLAAANSAIAAGAHEIWDDWARIRSYDSAARLQFTEWVRANQAVASGVHLLVGSSLIAMGATVANLALGNVFHVTADRAQFEGAILARLC